MGFLAIGAFILMCVLSYALMNTGKRSRELSDELAEKYYDKKDEKKQEE